MSQIDNFLSGGGGGSTQIFYNITKPQLDNLIQNNLLSKGAMYKISGVHAGTEGLMPLYYDGETVGVTVILEAVANNQLAITGTGIFYNPTYNVEAPNASMWNPDGTYIIGDVVYYGGYAWVNLNGNVGSPESQVNLGLEWEKIPYSNTNYYTIAYDEIDYDYKNDLIIRRYESFGNNEVTCSVFSYYLLNFQNNVNLIHPISLFKWGYSLNFSAIYGIANVKIEDSLFNCVNSPARLIYDVTLTNNCRFDNVVMGTNTFINNLYLRNTSRITNSIIYGGFNYISLNEDSYIENINQDSNSNIYEINLQNKGNISDSIFVESTISNFVIKDGGTFINNNLNYSNIYGVDMSYLSVFSSCIFNSTQLRNIILLHNTIFNIIHTTSNCVIENLNLKQESRIQELSFENNCVFSKTNLSQRAYITNITFQDNTVFSSNEIGIDSVIANTTFAINSTFRNNNAIDSLYINNVTLSADSKIEKCIFNNMATLSSVILNNSVYLIDNVFENNSQIVNIIIAQTIVNTIFEQNTVMNTTDLSLSTYIFHTYPKKVFILPNGTVKIRMYDNSGTLLVKDITA